MNSTHRSIWNTTTGTFVAVSEKTASAGKKSSSCKTATNSSGIFRPTTLAISLMTAFAANVYALPTGGVVAAGAARIGSAPGSTTITQSTPSAVINWQSFGIGKGEAVRFVQPGSDSVALNRVVGSDPSAVLGSLTANGKVFLVNPNGILFGRGAQVNVAGLVASTRNIADSDFSAGKYVFAGHGGGAVVNEGSINADGGYVALLGASVSNQGVISARLGSVALVSGNAVTLDVAGDGLLNVAVNQGAVNALVSNGGLIQADGGQVVLSARSAGGLLPSAVNNTGVIHALSIENHNGTIRLLGDAQGGSVTVAGTLDASGTGAGQTGGSVQVLGRTVELAGAAIDVSGDAGGGLVLVGGNFHGAGPQANAQSTSLDGSTRIHADAVRSGNGGRIAVWSDARTAIAGTLSARGGAASGNGGFVETSGRQLVLADTTKVDTRAPRGKTGDWLLDPVNWTIATAGGDETPAQVTASLASSNRLITADNDITVADALTWTTPQTLELRAGHDVRVNAAVTASTAGSAIVLTAVNDVLVAAAMTASGAGSVIRMTAGRDVTAGAAITASANGALIDITAGGNASVGVVTADGGGAVNLRAGNDVIVSGAIGADTGAVTLRADSDGSGPGAAQGTVSFVGPGGVSAVNTTIRFNPNGYANTTTEIAAYRVKVVAGTLDAKAWVFAQGDSKTYDGTTAATLSYRGTPTVGNDVTLVAGTANFDTKNVGTAKPIVFDGYTVGGADLNKFSLFSPIGVASGSGTTTADIRQRALSVTATGTNKVYDGNTSDTVTLGDNRLAGDALTVTNTAANFADPNVGNGKPVSVTGINLTGTDAGNYSFNTAAATAANITPAPLSVRASDAVKTYGATPSLSAFSQVGLVAGETIGSVIEVSPGTATTASVAGGPYPILPSGASGGSFTPSNYTITYLNGALTVNPAPLTLKANDASKTYGDTPTLTAFTSGGLLNGETVGGVTETSAGTLPTAAVAGSPYPIIPSSATGGSFTPSNYVIAYLNGALTVTPAPLTVRASDASKIYGETPTLTAFSAAGLVNGETVGSVIESSAGTVATAGVAGIAYAIAPSGASGGSFSPSNYRTAYVDGALSVVRAALTVRASDASKVFGETPALTAFTAVGLVNGETIGGVAETSPGTAASASVAGSTYPITPGSASGGSFAASNYAIAYVNGALTVTPAALTPAPAPSPVAAAPVAAPSPTPTPVDASAPRATTSAPAPVLAAAPLLTPVEVPETALVSALAPVLVAAPALAAAPLAAQSAVPVGTTRETASATPRSAVPLAGAPAWMPVVRMADTPPQLLALMPIGPAVMVPAVLMPSPIFVREPTPVAAPAAQPALPAVLPQRRRRQDRN